MCGFAGIFGEGEDGVRRLRRAAEMMRHRGPDATSIFEGDRFSAVFCRLSIIDLSEAANQPLANETGDVSLLCNGEIYNFQELRTELEGRHEFRSHSDCEVLVHGYEEWGFEELLRRIDGFFAIALWDRRTGDLFLARDRVGKKPLYYSDRGGVVVFASSLNALVELLGETPELDPVALDEFLVYQAVPAPRTIYAGVQMLPPAHWLHFPRGKASRLSRYWDLSYATKQRRSERDLLEELDGLVQAAVQRRLIADVPLGAFLSGGVDSSLLVGVMSAHGAGPIDAIHVGFQDSRFDERPYARAVAQRWGARLHEHIVDPNEVEHLPEILWHYGQPIADVSIVPTFAVARAAREHVTVVINGDGGDEVFAGYARPIVARAAQAFRRSVPRGLQPVGLGLGRRMGRRGSLLVEAASVSGRQSFVYDRGLRSLRSSLYSPDFLSILHDRDPDEAYGKVWDRADGPSDVDRALYGDLTTYLPDQLLVKMDVSTMAHSVEARSPLLDTRLMTFAASIPAEQLTRGYQTKYLLKRLAERYVPRHVLYRRKRGFVMPASDWLRGPLKPVVHALLLGNDSASRRYFDPASVRSLVDEHESGVRDRGGPLFTMLTLELFLRLFVEKTISRSDQLKEIAA